jgi:DNA modification methylase
MGDPGIALTPQRQLKHHAAAAHQRSAAARGADSVWAKIIIGDSRSMAEVGDQTIDLVVTSPPYWHIKDYGAAGQIGYGQTLHRYLEDLYRVWAECHRALAPGSRLCINVGDQFARAAVYGRYRVIPIHAETIAQCERIGFDFLGSVIWQKRTTVNTTGGANVMGSYPFPPNGVVEIDYEFIHIFKKPGKPRKVAREVKEASRLSKAEWKEYFAGHWRFGGARQVGHEARFPDELPRRLIRMFTFAGDTVLDPFLGSGTTARVAVDLGRNAVGYEINPVYLRQMRAGLDTRCARGSRARGARASGGRDGYEEIRAARRTVLEVLGYKPAISDARPVSVEQGCGRARPQCRKVAEIIDERTLKLEDGRTVKLRGIGGVGGTRAGKRTATIAYLTRYVLGKAVFLKAERPAGRAISAYVYLKNRIFLNGYLVRSGLAPLDRRQPDELLAKYACRCRT